jgi:hypothetical protein
MVLCLKQGRTLRSSVMGAQLVLIPKMNKENFTAFLLLYDNPRVTVVV